MPDNADEVFGDDLQAPYASPIFDKDFTLLGFEFVTVFSSCDRMLSGGFFSRSRSVGPPYGEFYFC